MREAILGHLVSLRPSRLEIERYVYPSHSHESRGALLRHRPINQTGLIRANNVQHPSLSLYSTDSLSTNEATYSSTGRLSDETAPTDSELSDAPDLERVTLPKDGTLEALAVPSSCYSIRAPDLLSNTPSSILAAAPDIGPVVTEGPGASEMSDTENGAEGQLCKAEALGTVPVYGLPCIQQPIKRKLLPADNKAVAVQPQPIELSADGERFSKELEQRFSLAASLGLPSVKTPRPSTSSSLTTSLGKSLAVELLCYPSYGKETAVTQRHRSIREAFQEVVSGSSSMRWLKSIGKGKKKFSRLPIPDF